MKRGDEWPHSTRRWLRSSRRWATPWTTPSIPAAGCSTIFPRRRKGLLPRLRRNARMPIATLRPFWKAPETDNRRTWCATSCGSTGPWKIGAKTARRPQPRRVGLARLGAAVSQSLLRASASQGHDEPADRGRSTPSKGGEVENRRNQGDRKATSGRGRSEVSKGVGGTVAGRHSGNDCGGRPKSVDGLGRTLRGVIAGWRSSKP